MMFSAKLDTEAKNFANFTDVLCNVMLVLNIFNAIVEGVSEG